MLLPRVSGGAATTPGGSTTQVQYNNAGAFGGVPGFIYDAGNTALQFAPGSIEMWLADSGQVRLSGVEAVLDCKSGSAYVGDFNGAGQSTMLQVDDGNARVTLNKYFILTDDTKQLVLKSPDGHYWHVQVDNAGALGTTDLGTSLP